MKIAVFSDSHGETDSMLAVIKAEKPEMVIHLGDCLSDGSALRTELGETPMLCVRGNCDWSDSHHPETETAELCGRKVFLTHGHLYGVKNGLNRILLKGRETGADLVLFGHTHQAYIDQNGPVRLFNPGAMTGRGRDNEKTYGIVHLSEDEIRCEIKSPD
jgi:hypothetical protein